MIHIKNNDTLIDIIGKIENSPSESIILKFPIGHSILHNHLSLKLIKSKAKNKKITIITSDILSRKIGKKLGINYTIISNTEFIEQKKQDLAEENLVKLNFSFKEYLLFEMKKYYREVSSLIQRNKNINHIKSYSQKYKSFSNVGIFAWLLLVSIVLFIAIFYFAINKTIITITPEIVVKKKAKNFIFQEINDFDTLRDDKIINISTLDKELFLSDTYSTTWIQESSVKKSRGKIEISNLSKEEIKLLPETRFVTQDGILFETESWIILPPAIIDNFWAVTPGTKQVEIISQNYDNTWNFIGSSGNIEKDTLLTLPWLNDNGSTVSAIALDDFKGGSDTYTRAISEQDLESSVLIFEQKIKNRVIEQLRSEVQTRNKEEKISLDIISIDNIIEYSDFEFSIQDQVELWDIAESITIEWSIKWKTYVYDQEEVINKLRTVIQENILEWVENILLIDRDSLRISSLIYRREDPTEVKATVEIDVLISHDFQNQENSYLEKLRSTIRGIEKREATKLLLNDPKISNVSIDIRPFFLKHISNISENIIFEVE